jgi:hypothetical protein
MRLNVCIALGGRVVDGDQRVVDQTEERVPVVLVVPNRRRQRLGRQQRRFDVTCFRAARRLATGNPFESTAHVISG